MDHYETREAAKQAVMDTLQNVYGDSTQSTLDRKAADEVVKALERMGWMDPYTLRWLVHSAGDTVTLSDDLMMKLPDELLFYRQMDPPASVIKTRHSTA